MPEYESHFADQKRAMNSLDDALYELWEKMKKAVEKIGQLKTDNDTLKERNEYLEELLTELQDRVEKKSRRIEELESAVKNNSGIDGGERVFYLSNEEREQLEKRIDELLRKIDSHLNS